MYQKITIVGNLGRDPEMKVTQAGKTVTTFSVAVTEWDKSTTWFRVNVWGKQAETADQYLSKGSKVLVEGTLKSVDGAPPTFTDKQGLTRASFEISATNVRFLSTKAENDNAGDYDDNNTTGNADEVDEIPF